MHGIASVLEVCLICRPLATQWDSNIKGLCGNQTASFIAVEVSGLVLDLAILVSPLPTVYSLMISRARKATIILLLDAGAL